jgi:hypothetical protein
LGSSPWGWRSAQCGYQWVVGELGRGAGCSDRKGARCACADRIGKREEGRLETGVPPEAVVADRRWREKNKQVRTQWVSKSDPNGLDQVWLLASRNYKVSATVGLLSTVVATPFYAILDTGVGPNLVREDVLPEDWTRYRVMEGPSFQVVGASGRPLPQRGVLTLCVQLGRLKVHAKFIVVKYLMAGCILGCQFIDRHVKSILPKERRVLLNDDSSVAILYASPDRSIGNDDNARHPRTPQASTKVRIARFVTIPARSEGFVDVQCEAPGLRFLKASLRGSSIGI